MSTPAERVLEYALQVHFGRVPARDLRPEILRAWERGVGGAALDELLTPELEFEPLAQHPKVQRAPYLRRAPWLLLPVAALFLLYVYFRPPPVAEPDGTLAQLPVAEHGESAQNPPQVPGPAQEGATKLAVDRSAPRPEEVERSELLYRRMIWADVSGLPAPLTFSSLRQSSSRAVRELTGVLATRPPLWEVLAPSLRETMQDRATDDEMRMVVLDLCTREGSIFAMELAREFWAAMPSAFHVDHLVTLAEHGASEFELELAAIIEDGVGFKGQSRVMAAAYFALRGDDRGRAILREGLVTSEFNRSYVPLPLIACLALGDLGEAEVWSETLVVIIEELRSLLQSERADLARPMLIATEYFLDLRKSARRPKLSALPDEEAAYSSWRTLELESQASLVQAIAALAER